MKSLKSSDMNPMVLAIMNNTTLGRSTPVSTALIWGLNVFPGASTAIWEPAALGCPERGGVNRRQHCTAIWGTCGVGAPLRPAEAWQAMKPWQAIEISR
jgi:hypothetical protein